MSTFEELRLRAQNELIKFRNKEQFDNHSGIEISLVQPYLDQIIELNKYIITDFSTNYPANELFEPMAIMGIIENDKIEAFVNTIRKLDVSYKIGNYERINPFLCHLNVIQDMHSRWFFNKNTYRNNATKEGIDLWNNEKYTSLALKIRENNIRTLEELNDEDKEIIKEIVNKFYFKQSYFNEEIEGVMSLWDEFNNLENISRFTIVANDPFKRTLYELLVDCFKIER